MTNYQTPDALAKYVFKELKRSKIKDKSPSEEILSDLFNTLYYASLQTEEGQYITVTITLLDHNPLIDIGEDEEEIYDNWKFYPFKDKIEFNIKNLVKLSKAADPWSSSLSVYYNENEILSINGMIDQTIHYQSYLNYEREDEPEYPGIIQCMINGIGILSVMLDYQPLATLNQNTLLKNYLNVFQFGPISEFLKANTTYGKSTIEKIIKEEIDEDFSKELNDEIFTFSIQALSRLLIRIRNYHHGGAILITKDFTKDLKIKYNIKYNRISIAIQHVLSSLIDCEFFYDEIKVNRKKKKDITVETHDNYIQSEDDLEDSNRELTGGVRFVSSLSCVDGLIILSPHLDVQGFGAIITRKTMPEKIYLNKITAKLNEKQESVDPKHFGTRHQSMFAYCLEHPESIGFVISQDGEIRAIKNVDGKVIIWENIKVHQFIRSSKLPRRIAIIRK